MEKAATTIELQAESCELRHVPVPGDALMCHQTAAGSWVCCSCDGAPTCATGLTLDGAVANWERAQRLLE
jgi:hypothetical protein